MKKSIERINFYILIYIILEILLWKLTGFFPLILLFISSLFVNICFFLLPVSLIGILLLSIIQFIIKDFKKLYTFFMSLLIIYFIGILEILKESFSEMNKISIPFVLTLLFIIFHIISLIFLTHKKDTRYCALFAFLSLISFVYILTMGV